MYGLKQEIASPDIIPHRDTYDSFRPACHFDDRREEKSVVTRDPSFPIKSGSG